MTVTWIWLVAALGAMAISEIPSYLSRHAKTAYGKFAWRCYDGMLTLGAIVMAIYAFSPWWLGVIIVLVGYTLIVEGVKKQLGEAEKKELGLK